MSVQSPFANFEPGDIPSTEKLSARGQRALENISPLFERLILQQESEANAHDGAGPIKRRLTIDDASSCSLLHSSEYAASPPAVIQQ